MSPVPALDLTTDVVGLTAALVDIASESLHEQEIADAIEAALSPLDHLEIVRDGHTIVARTHLGRSERVVIAGHVDTVPANGNFPSRLEDGILHGLGSCDMKGGVAVALTLAATVPEPVRDVTYVFYDAEEIAAEFNGLGRIARERPELLAGDFAILMEPSDAGVEAGCQGTMRVEIRTAGERAHSARSWMGSNAIHALAPVLATLTTYEPRHVEIDGLVYREGLNAVGISGGVAGNVVPDEAVVTVNYRFAPDRSEDDALAHLNEVFGGFELTVTDTAPGALPGLTRPAAAAFVEAVGAEPRPKFGWTDVAQFTLLGVPAVNYGPGDPVYAHKADEQVPVEHLVRVLATLEKWLSA
ncbi:succinyl-diaminopimelate desuccinylase [Aeromicrobium sp. SMF47]|uniref:Succinyl-diaminopimelate desuccinylase n=1 Tax=Aeromicrobium yanjiei TaxID=2662028 RepID=A0A5Q2MHK2_9ACTN|nr:MULTISPECIES: succinyl-diaminopimelate desuccinylase [Aeromicrobium]MRJ74992.1 succinyl-diaminopimelate desuccinylase [Aeromicrobium yanjiei]MRK02953.1 succinyl-diaminopimelate desuccinylase [Aeromicrobium sp. S22]QGG40516.1 succinyl-diaminopimelate desuccinylase [Aeromicrobium yanjiei]